MYINEKNIIKNPIKAYKNLAIPLILFAIVDAFYMIIDAFWASFIGIECVIAVGVSAPILSLIGKFASTLGQGTNSYMSQSFGGDNPKQANNTLLHGLIIGLIISILVPLLSLPFLTELLGIFNYNGSLEDIIYYIIPILTCTFVFILTSLLSETIQSEGDSKRPTTFIFLGNGVNFVLSPILGLGCGLGVLGLSLATVIGQIVPLSLFLYMYLRQDKLTAKLSFKEFKFEPHIIKEIIKVTIPNFIDRSLYSILGIYINLVLTLTIGAEYIAIYTFCTNISDLIQSPSRGSTKGLLTIGGHLYGAGRIDKLKRVYKFGLTIGILLSVITSILLLFFNYIISPYIDPSILNLIDLNSLAIALIIMNILIAIAKAVSRTLDGIGKSIYSLIGSIINIIFGLGLITVFALLKLTPGYEVILGLVIADIIATCYYIGLIQWVFNKLEKDIKISPN